MWDAILHRKWEKGNITNDIIHYWAEDGSPVIIKVPYQLRDDIVEIQNWLSEKYQKIEEAQNKLARAKRFFSDVRRSDD